MSTTHVERFTLDLATEGAASSGISPHGDSAERSGGYASGSLVGGQRSALTPVERTVAASQLGGGRPPAATVPVVTVASFPALGRLAALRFFEWLLDNPEGVISLPTGKTPEYFIKNVTSILSTWESKSTQSLLEAAGITQREKPEMRGIHFVQMDEFFPIAGGQLNSFFHYVSEYYIKGFGFDRSRALLINCSEIGLRDGQTLDSVWPSATVDLNLRTRRPVTSLERTQRDVLLRVDAWCQQREEAIRELGGIGFFIGGLGPDGHVAFNICGSSHFSVTRLLATNYETQAASAGALGGIENARRPVISIGLGTITFNPDCAAIIFAAGAAKARVVATAVEGLSSVLIPASALRVLPNARFYLTQGAASLLTESRMAQASRSNPPPDEVVERVLVDLACARGKRLVDLSTRDVQQDPVCEAVLSRRREPLSELSHTVRERLIQKLEQGVRPWKDTRFLHGEPHHDDLCLGLLEYICHNRGNGNIHHFATLTSGFTAVSNAFLLGLVGNLRDYLASGDFASLSTTGYFQDEKQSVRDVSLFLDGIAARSHTLQHEAAARRFLRSLCRICGETDLRGADARLIELDHYLTTAYAGKKDQGPVQRLKGACREWEAECFWACLGYPPSNVHHLRLPFYNGDMFTPTPTLSQDASLILHLLDALQPEVVSVALDPEGAGPDTHYKSLQATNEAIQVFTNRDCHKDIRVIGYRNVWHRFHPSEANLFVPVPMEGLSCLAQSFLNTFATQRSASFPSHEYEGPFSELAQEIQFGQFRTIRTCLGSEWFEEHSSHVFRAARGLVFLREMDVDEFCCSARRIQESTEGRNCPAPHQNDVR